MKIAPVLARTIIIDWMKGGEGLIAEARL